MNILIWIILGQLSLTTVELGTVKSRPSLRAIGDLCPSLDEASFSGSDWEVGDDDLVSPEGARTILNKWPKVYTPSHINKLNILTFKTN